jgi:hypothetical protein
MRELFTPPEAEIITFAAQDIVTTSPGNGDIDDDRLPEDDF